MKQRRPLLGFLLALNTAVFWGLLPIIMKQTLVVMDPITVVWYRFIASALCLGILLKWKKQLPNPATFSRQQIWLFVMGGFGLAANFALYNSSLKYINPANVQVLGQLGSMLLLVTSAPILKEHLHRSQIVGVLILIVGILLFFNTNLIKMVSHFDTDTIGIILAGSASVIWLCYGFAQKLLSRSLHSQQILWLVYCLCAVFLAPFAKPSTILNMNTWQFACLLFCAANTLIAYGCFAESLMHWQTAKSSAVISVTPLCTLIFADIMSYFWPNLFEAIHVNLLGYIGAIVVVSGMILSVIGHALKPLRKPNKTHLSQSPQI